MQRIFPLLLFLLPLAGCIGDDLVYDTVDPVIRITGSVDTLTVGSMHQFQFRYFNNIGVEEPVSHAAWLSTAPEIIAIDQTGLATALQAGEARIEVHFTPPGGVAIADSVRVVAGDTTSAATERRGTIRTTSSYQLEGDFTLRAATAGGLELALADNFRASTSLPGLYLYLTNNPNTTQGGLEVGMVQVFSGAHTIAIPGNVGLNDYKYLLYYCKPFNVKVGDGEIK